MIARDQTGKAGGPGRRAPWALAVVLSAALLMTWSASGVLGAAAIDGGDAAEHFRALSGIAGTLHDLSAGGGSGDRAVDEKQICIFCHTPHGGAAGSPLWNRSGGGAIPRPYGLAEGAMTEVDDRGLCLSCHDGTTALGEVRNRSEPIAMRGDGRLRPEDDARPLIGSGAHPVGGRGQDSGVAPTWDSGPRRPAGCTSCHEPHDDRNFRPGKVPHFWRDSAVSTTCLRCHQAPLRRSAHSPTTLPMGCASCHLGHGQPGTPMLSDTGSAPCLRCHGKRTDTAALIDTGLLAIGKNPVDVESEFERPHRHPLGDSTWAGRTKSIFSGTAEPCGGCHPTHGPEQSGLADARGLTLGVAATADDPGGCLECHDDLGRASALGPDIKSLLSARARSSHPVGRRPAGTVAGLRGEAARRAPMSGSSGHGSEDEGAPRGPHGSAFDGILRAAYDAESASRGGGRPWDLCFGCHDRSTLVAGREGWPGHRAHVGLRNAGCASCHDPHGSEDFPGLISFGQDLRSRDATIDRSGRLEYQPGRGLGMCFLLCHGAEHGPTLSIGPVQFGPAGAGFP